MKNAKLEKHDEDLSPEILSSKQAYFFWSAAYSGVHLCLCSYLLLRQPSSDLLVVQWIVLGITFGPFFYLYDLYIRQIWWPYRQEVYRRGKLPSERWRQHPYDFKKQVFVVIPFFAGLLACTAAIAFDLFPPVDDQFLKIFALTWCVVGTPATCFGLYHTFFIWKGLAR